MKNTQTVLAVLLVAMSAACTVFIPDRLPRSAIADLQGTWLSKGFGYVAQVNREQLRLFTIAGSSCYAEDYSFKELAYDFPHFIKTSADQIELGEKEDGKHVLFKRIDAVPPPCLRTNTDGPLLSFDAFANIMAEHYPFFELHQIDWQQRVYSGRSSLNINSSDAELADAMFAALEGFKDSHLGVLASINGERVGQSRRYVRDVDRILQPRYELSGKDKSYSAFRKQWINAQRTNVAKALLGANLKSRADGKLIWGSVDGVAYLQVKQFLGYSRSGSADAELAEFGKHLDHILKSIADSRALLLDVSLARGGYGDLAFELASRFAATAISADQEQLLVHRSYPFNVGKSRMREKYLRVSMRERFDKPVAVLASGATTSAAEEFLLAMRVLPHVHLAGQPSNGSLSDIMEKQLPNGWLMVLSNEVYESADGEVFEGLGIPVDKSIELFSPSNPEQSYLEAVLSEFRQLGS